MQSPFAEGRNFFFGRKQVTRIFDIRREFVK